MIEKKKIIKLPPDLYSRNTTIALMIQKLSFGKPTHVLDVGGYGGKLSWFLPDETKIIILDQKPNPLSQPQEQFEEQLPNEQYMQGDARNLPFPDNSFEIVVASDLLEHVKSEDRQKVLSELCRVSKDYVIMGAPFYRDVVQNIEHIISQQYVENTGNVHPFLMEHKNLGLPDQTLVEKYLHEQNYQFFHIQEGNVVNWALQQLSIGMKTGESTAADLTKFNEYFNEHLFQLGNFEEPGYRTIFCISKIHQTAPMGEIIKNELRSRDIFSPRTYAYLLKVAFGENRKILLRRKQQLNMVADITIALKEKVKIIEEEHARLEKETYDLRAELAEKGQNIDFMQATLNEKMAILDQLEEEKAELAKETAEVKKQLNESNEDNRFFKKHLLRQEQVMKDNLEQLVEKDLQIHELNLKLSEYKKSLEEILKSRAWKAIQIYGRAKNKFLIEPSRTIKNGISVLTTLGPKTFWIRLKRKLKKSHSDVAVKTQYQLYLEQNRLTPQLLKQIKAEQEQFEHKPVISIIMPVYNIEASYLIKAIDSVLNQTYPRWELCMADDASTAPHIKPLLEKYAKMDSRFKVFYRKENGGIVKASNDALKISTGSYIGLLDNDDELDPTALYEVVKTLQEKKYDLVYSDEDKLELDGTLTEPTFKPDWSPDLLFSCNYISHFGVYRKKIVQDLGGFREGYDGSQDYDLVLRFTEKTNLIKHIPKILYHWRKIPGSTASHADAKPYAFISAKKALQDALKRRKIDGEVMDGMWKGSYYVKRTLKTKPVVSIIIPFRDTKEVLEKCVESVLAKTSYEDYEILLIDNQSIMLETKEYLRKTAQHERVRVIEYNQPFNYSALNNFAVKHAKGDIIVLLNNDTEIITPNWIEGMLIHAQRSEVGAVGAKLLYPNDTLQHGGVILGLGGVAGHAFTSLDKNDPGYFGQASVIRNYSAVTAACIMMRKDVFEKLGGLDEKNLAVAFNDVDLCLRLREAGYLIVYTPYVSLYHYESYTRGKNLNMNEVKYMQQRWGHLINSGDPYYNPNLTLERSDFSLRTVDKVQQ